MNLANKTVVKSIPIESNEYSMVQNLCDYGTNMRPINSKTRVNGSKAADKWEPFRDLIIKVETSLNLKCPEMRCTIFL